MGIDYKFDLMLSEDGSGRGAALVAAVLKRGDEKWKTDKPQTTVFLEDGKKTHDSLVVKCKLLNSFSHTNGPNFSYQINDFLHDDKKMTACQLEERYHLFFRIDDFVPSL